MKLFPVAFLSLALLMAIRLSSHHSAAAGWQFADDGAYLDQCVARTLASDHLYGVGPGHAIPAIEESLWRVLLAPAALMRVEPGLFAIALGCVAAALALWFGFRLARRMNESAAGTASVFLALGAAWPAAVASGTSNALAAVFVVSAMWLYARGYADQEEFLPLSAAWLVGLAALLHVEMAVVWVVIVLHAMVWTAVTRGRRTMVVALLRGLSGALLIALVLSPLIAWNMKTLGVPWPRLPSEVSIGTEAAVRLAFAKLHSLSCLSVPAVRLVFWLGVAALFIDFLRDRSRWGFGFVLFAYALTPIFFGALTPVFGWGGAAALFTSLNALWIITIAQGVFAIGQWLLRGLAVLRKDALPGWAPRLALLLPALLVGAILLKSFRIENRDGRDAVQQAGAARAALRDAHERGDLNTKTAVTDRPGWLTLQNWFPLVDLTGQTSIHILALVKPDGLIDVNGLSRLMSREGVERVILWGEHHDNLRNWPGLQPLAMPEGAPFVGRITSSSAP